MRTYARVPALAFLGLLVIQFASPASAQFFNIDIDTTGTNQQLGNGVPSDAFGAAAGQPGRWNSMLTSGPVALSNLAGAATGATISITATSTSNSVLGFNNAANTGDFALLLNDGSQIGTTTQGGTRTYTIAGIANGPYSVWTYTARPQAVDGHLIIDVAGSNEGALVATGVPTGNTFTLGVSHVVHTLNVTSNTININLTDVAGAPAGYVDGFQIAAIPEPATAGLLIALAAFCRRRRRAALPK